MMQKSAAITSKINTMRELIMLVLLTELWILPQTAGCLI